MKAGLVASPYEGWANGQAPIFMPEMQGSAPPASAGICCLLKIARCHCLGFTILGGVQHFIYATWAGLIWQAWRLVATKSWDSPPALSRAAKGCWLGHGAPHLIGPMGLAGHLRSHVVW